MNSKLCDALRYAASAHALSTRKGSANIPYIIHPCEAAMLLLSDNADEDLVCAALLHDTVEDTPVTIEDIKEHFGEHIATLVASNSEDKSKSWEERKQHTIHFLLNEATREQGLLICADKLSNLRSIAYDMREQGESVWSRFKRDKTMQRWYYTGICEALKPLSGVGMYEEFKTLCNEVFGTQAQ